MIEDLWIENLNRHVWCMYSIQIKMIYPEFTYTEEGD